jgi:glycosyltransferase involved in cell wall biosynthesis
MNVLMVTCGLPYPPVTGTQLRDYHLLRQLSAYASVSLCSLLTEDLAPDLSELSKHCASIDTCPLSARPRVSQLAKATRWPLACLPFHVPEMAQKIRSRITIDRIDVVQIEHSFLACYLDAIPAGFGGRAVLDLHNVGELQYERIASLEHAPLRRLSFQVKSLLMRGWEPRVAARFAHTIAVSEEDRRYILAANPSLRVSVIENGVDAGVRKPASREFESDELIFVGVLGYPPNADAVVHFQRDILPLIRRERPDAHLTVIGRSAPPAVQALDGRAGITVAGFVDDLAPYYRRAKVAIVPLRAGGGSRLKILEAMAVGRPVVSTAIGCEGLAVVHGKHLLVGDTPAEFAGHVLRLLRDEPLQNELAGNARRLVEERYDWPILGGRLFDLYRDLLAP